MCRLRNSQRNPRPGRLCVSRWFVEPSFTWNSVGVIRCVVCIFSWQNETCFTPNLLHVGPCFSAAQIRSILNLSHRIENERWVYNMEKMKGPCMVANTFGNYWAHAMQGDSATCLGWRLQPAARFLHPWTPAAWPEGHSLEPFLAQLKGVHGLINLLSRAYISYKPTYSFLSSENSSSLCAER